MKRDNSPAFPTTHLPQPNSTDPAWNEPGMTLRDYFAAHAPEPPRQWYYSQPADEAGMATWLRWRWVYADMMMAERAK